METCWTQQNSLQIFTVGHFSSSKIKIGVPHFVLCCVLAYDYELFESVLGAFFVLDDYTYKVDSCEILHDVFTVQRPMVATVAQPKQYATMVCRSLHLTPSLVALVTSHTAYHDIVGRVTPVALAWRSSICDQHTLAAQSIDLNRGNHKKTIWLLAGWGGHKKHLPSS